MPEIQNILRFTHSEEFSYDRDKVLDVAKWMAEADLITIPNNADLDDIIREVFEATYDSLLGNELFYGLSDFNVGIEMFTRSEDE